MLELPIHRAMRFLLVSPHYPENVGAACRALKAMGFSKLGLVTPAELASPTHPMAQKMAVKSLDVLDSAALFDSFDDAILGSDVVVGTTARRGVSMVLPPCRLADTLVSLAAEGKRITMVFGNEKSGLTSEQLAQCHLLVRIPLAGDQPSLNLAQAVQIITYELFRSGLAKRQQERDSSRERDSSEHGASEHGDPSEE
jgi:TrmH family RNA methyltransferase